MIESETFAPYVAERVREDLTGGRLDRAERDAIVAALRRCYAAAGLPWPDRVAWASSPRVGALAAQTAAATVTARREPVPCPVRRRADLLLRWAVNALAVFVGCVLYVGFFAGLGVAVVLSVVGAVLRLDISGGTAWMCSAIGGGIAGVLIGGVAVADTRRDVVANRFQAERAQWIAAGSAEIAATRDRIRAATVDAAAAGLDAVVTPAAERSVRDGVGRAVDAATVGVWEAVLGDPRWVPSDEIVRRARQVAAAAVGPGPQEPPPPKSAVLAWSRHAPYTPPPEAHHRDGRDASLLWWRRHGGVDLDGDLWDRLDAYATAGRLRWWAHPDFVVVSKPPIELHVERGRSGEYQVHRADGPALRWRDGPTFWYWRGVPVPADLIRGMWDVDRIHSESNSEVRRAAIERMGWLTYLTEARLRLVASAPDPGNEPHDLRLYEDPTGRLGDARILVMTNGSPDRSGRVRRYAEAVPGHFADPVAAAAWQYDCPVDTYRLLGRRT